MNEASWRPAPELSWAVETRGITLVCRRRGAFACIPYPYAGLWAVLVEGGCTRMQARELMTLLMGTGPEEAEDEVVRTLAAWRDAGLLVSE